MNALRDEPVVLRRALEALRNGVPNHDAVRVLGCEQDHVQRRFAAQLDTIRDEPDRQAPGLLLGGGFGSGKSHVLQDLERRALEAGLVCSRIVISKETPLHDLDKVFRAAVASATVPGHAGPAVAELAQRLDPATEAHADLVRWVNSSGQVSPLVAATLLLHERLRGDPEITAEVVDFWSGDRLSPTRVRQGLRACGAAADHAVRVVPGRQLVAERFALVARLCRAAGFGGWVLLVDEVELIGRYSLQQRGRAYAEVARWMGRLKGSGFAGLGAVLAVTDDFDIHVLQEKGDRERVPEKLRIRGKPELDLVAREAELGMRCLARDVLPLDPPTDDSLRRTYATLRRLHAAAYGWEAPDADRSETSLRRPMRLYVRRWINEWDLARLYPGETIETQVTELHPTYAEEAELADGDGKGGAI